MIFAPHRCRLFFLILNFFGLSLFGQQRLLSTESVETVPEGNIRFELGMEFLQDVKIPLAGLKGDLTRIGVFALRTGVGARVEIQVMGTIRNHLDVEERFPAPNSGILNFSGNSTADFGDLTTAAKVQMVREGGSAPGLGLRFGFELPNASNESGLGNDETNAFTTLLVEKHLGSASLQGNIGLAVLGDPVSAGAQDDLLTWGLAARVPVSRRIQLLGDFHGRSGSGGIGTEEQAFLRTGAQIRGGGFYWDFGLLFGFQDSDPDVGILFGLSRDFPNPLWH